MAKHSRAERERRAAKSERIAEIQRAWQGSVSSATAAQFATAVRAAIERGPAVPPPGHGAWHRTSAGPPRTRAEAQEGRSGSTAPLLAADRSGGLDHLAVRHIRAAG